MIVRALAVVALVGLAGCVGPYTVHQQSHPNPFTAERSASFAVLPLDFTEAHIDEGSPLNPWTPEDHAEFERAKAAMNVAFQRELVGDLRHGGIAAHPASADESKTAKYLIQPRVLEVLPGELGGVGRSTTRVRMGVAIATPAGEVLDVVEVEHGTIPDQVIGDLQARLVVDTGTAGERVAIYVRERIVPGTELK